MARGPNWEKRLSYAAKAEMLAATFHLLTDHTPEVWRKVPAWLRSQIRQAMRDCSTEYRDFTREDVKACADYGQWLSEKYPQPGSTLDRLLRKRKPMPKRPRYLHYAIMSGYKDIGQVGCAWGESLADAESMLPAEDHGKLVRMSKKDCKLCKEEGR